ncbi:MAG: hypothetical protein E7354_03695 [Clostridiales bacterium]|nr:hypothetical protein [Clostridiales bacterium]
MKLGQKSKFNYTYWTILVVMILVAFVWGVVRVTTSWFEDESTTSNPDPSVSIIGTLDLDIITNFQLRNLVLSPDTTYLVDKDGQDIGTYIKTSEKHNIDGAYVRVKYTSTRPELTLFFDANNYTTTTTYSAAVENKWFYNTTDGFYYYIGYIDDDNTQFNAGYYVDNTLDNTKAGADCQVTLYFETIQRQYGASDEDDDWSTSPQIFRDFVAKDNTIKHNPND